MRGRGHLQEEGAVTGDKLEDLAVRSHEALGVGQNCLGRDDLERGKSE